MAVQDRTRLTGWLFQLSFPYRLCSVDPNVKIYLPVVAFLSSDPFFFPIRIFSGQAAILSPVKVVSYILLITV
jgi:hypothetical protein